MILQAVLSVSIKDKDKVDSGVPLVMQLKPLLSYYGLTHIGLVNGNDVERLISTVSKDDDYFLNSIRDARISPEVADVANDAVIVVIMYAPDADLRKNTFEALKRRGILLDQVRNHMSTSSLQATECETHVTEIVELVLKPRLHVVVLHSFRTRVMSFESGDEAAEQLKPLEVEISHLRSCDREYKTLLPEPSRKKFIGHEQGKKRQQSVTRGDMGFPLRLTSHREQNVPMRTWCNLIPPVDLTIPFVLVHKLHRSIADAINWAHHNTAILRNVGLMELLALSIRLLLALRSRLEI
ncbi:unnamed protein product [Eruca vesicaria subsp. sativa]|uniref:Uncharacterized protein n=1 Tax=Eruca vesicaria subsp. sativa TaxID=29727 RepID=A0ABC8LIV0_ERUVS|nr:unnamed protein product [Eruca vesicaria subsp. sativa]